MNNNYPVSLTANSSNYYIVFSLNDKQYAINIQNILEIINMPKIEISSKAPEGVTGMFNYNGMLTKTVDLCPFLGLETLPFSVNNQLIIVVVDDNCFAIHTEKIDNIVQFNIKDIQTVPFNLDNSIIKEIYKNEDKSINIIDTGILNKLITENRTKEGIIKYEKLFPSDEKSKQILELRALKNKASQEMFSFPINLSTANQYILFTLDNQNYYLDLKNVKEVISVKRLNITRLPYTKDFIKGIINLKGDFLVVVDLKRFLNNAENNVQEGSKLIITQGKDFNIAFLVDEILSIKNLQNTQITKSFSAGSAYIYAEFMEDNQLYSILNFEKIINDEKLYIDAGLA